MLKVSESYFVSIDISENDEAVMQVIKRGDGGRWSAVKTIVGPEAVDLHNKLTMKEND